MNTINFLYKRDASYVTDAALLALLDWVGSTYSILCSAGQCCDLCLSLNACVSP